MELTVISYDTKETSKITVADGAFGSKFNEGLVHQVINAYLSGGRRASTKAQKTRRETRGGGKKPWRQKGTGRARAGSTRSPIWRSGGVAFAARPRDFTQKVNRKMYHGAMTSILSELIRREQFMIVDSLKLNGPKTSALKELLKGLNLENALIIIDGDDRNIHLASRNIVGISLSDAVHVDPVSLISAENIVATIDAVKRLEKRLS